MSLPISYIIKNINCRIIGSGNLEAEIKDFLFDSRSLTDSENTLFCALKTASGDGHRFINDLFRRGVRFFLVEDTPNNVENLPGTIFLKVADVKEALEELAAGWRNDFKGTVIGITGSAGKTVVKEMLFKALASAGKKVSRSPRSWNSRLGVPLSLLEIESDDDFAIIEVGIDSPGDMESHSRIVRPDLGILTAITAEHEAGFSCLEEKILEKLIFFKDTEVIVYDDTNPLTEKIIHKTYPAKRLIGVSDNSHIECDKKIVSTVAELLRVKTDSISDSPAINRIDVHEGVNDCVMLYDDFTTDLRSLRWSLDFMKRRASDGRGATLILSDLEHGPMSDSELEALYRDLGHYLEIYGISRLIAIGSELKRFRYLIPEDITFENLKSVSEFLNNFDINHFSSETILISGSPAENFIEIKNQLESPRHDTILEVNLDALVNNFNRYRSLLNPETGIIAMVKASAYGIGALEVSKTLQSQGARYLAVAVVDEGVELRKGGITMPVMVLNPITTNYRALFRNNLEPSVFSLDELRKLTEEARKNGIAELKVHIKLDTGMHRVGFTAKELPELIEFLLKNPSVKVVSIFSHLATADCPDQEEYTRLQLDTFQELSAKILQALPYPVLRHILNTAGIMTHPEAQYDMVRLGIGLYGVDPLFKHELGLRPVATLKTTIISLRKWEEGTTIGYGRRGKLRRESVIATLPIGYADGVDRHLGCGNASFIIKGVECPTVGNICMDQCMIDVTDVPSVAVGDNVEIFGDRMSVEKIAEILGTIPYEVLTSVSPRVRRIYFRD